MNTPIGVFDSGVGGLTVVCEIMNQLPNEDIVYFGDTARVPYGCKSKDTIIRYSRQIASFLQSNNVKAIVVACNTATALALEEIKEAVDVPVIDVIKPGAKVASNVSKNGIIGIIGTEATINSEMYNIYIKEKKPNITVIGKACPLFVPLVEEGLLEDSVTVEIASRYMKDLQASNIDTLILGCTHYPLIEHTLNKIMGEGVILVNPAYETARALKTLLAKNNIISTNNITNHRFYVSDGAEKFKDFANTILSCKPQEIHTIKIEQY